MQNLLFLFFLGTLASCGETAAPTGSYSFTADDASKWSVTVNGNVSNRQAFAQKVAEAAARARSELSTEWFGKLAPELPAPIKVTVNIIPDDGTDNALGRGDTIYRAGIPGNPVPPEEFSMMIEGAETLILDETLRHETFHTVMASHFKFGIPSWCDEGASVNTQTTTRGQKNFQQFFIKFFNSKLPLDKLFTAQLQPQLTEEQALMIYAQGASVVRFLAGKNGKRVFTKFLADTFTQMHKERTANNSSTWLPTLKDYYKYNSFAELEQDWLKWYKLGEPDLSPTNSSSIEPLKLYTDSRFTLASIPAGTARSVQLCYVNSGSSQCKSNPKAMTLHSRLGDRDVFFTTLDTMDNQLIHMIDKNGKSFKVSASLK